MFDGGIAERTGCERFLPAADRGDAVEHEHQVVEQAFDVVVVTRRCEVELVGAHPSDDGGGDVDRGDELRTWVGGAGVVSGGFGGREFFSGHVSSVRYETGHLLSGLCGKIQACALTGWWPSC